jgi:radical SAM superfamily enzyme YgiQ (UPF0313 family)
MTSLPSRSPATATTAVRSGERAYTARRKRVLIINCYFPEIRVPVRLVHEIPNALSPMLLAGLFARTHCDVRLHNEVSEGFIEIFNPDLLAWPDMIVFTGLTDTFDRMLHATAYARTQNPSVITVAGGFAVRSFPRYSRQFFNYVCLGDIEQIANVIEEAFGRDHVADEPVPRYDLASWMGRRIAYVESSRNCNFRCSFCTLTARNDGYVKHSLAYLRRQIVALGKRDILLFLDNQFHGADRQFFVDRLELLRDLRQQGHFRFWSGFATNAFFWNHDEIELARQSGCFSLLVGVESFDEGWLRRVNKAQNNRYPQVEMIRRCLEAGILFQYGLVFDPTERRLADMHRELQFVCETPEVPPPNFIFSAIPFPATPFFRDRYRAGLLLPNLKVRDLEGSTLSMESIDAKEDVAHFLRTAKNLKGYQGPAIRHHAQFLRRYRDSLMPEQALASSISLGSILWPTTVSNPLSIVKRKPRRTHVCTTDRLDCVYKPRLPVDSEFSHYFTPTTITDAEGRLNDALVEDLLGGPH